MVGKRKSLHIEKKIHEKKKKKIPLGRIIGYMTDYK